MNEKIFSLQRFAKVTTKNLTAKADNYTNTKSNIVINALAGNDTVSNTANKVTVSGGDGKDTLEVYGTYSTVEGGTGNDSIAVYGYDSTITGGKGDDSIKSGRQYIYAYQGDDYDDEYAYRKTGGNTGTITAGSGNDIIENSQKLWLTAAKATIILSILTLKSVFHKELFLKATLKQILKDGLIQILIKLKVGRQDTTKTPSKAAQVMIQLTVPAQTQQLSAARVMI